LADPVARDAKAQWVVLVDRGHILPGDDALGERLADSAGHGADARFQAQPPQQAQSSHVDAGDAVALADASELYIVDAHHTAALSVHDLAVHHAFREGQLAASRSIGTQLFRGYVEGDAGEEAADVLGGDVGRRLIAILHGDRHNLRKGLVDGADEEVVAATHRAPKSVPDALVLNAAEIEHSPAS